MKKNYLLKYFRNSKLFMKYFALLRGVNVGGNSRVEMKKLKTQFESLGFTNVATYINSGNVIFESQDTKQQVLKKVEAMFHKEYIFPIPVLIKTSQEMKAIAHAIPKYWKQDSKDFRSDVAYLFKEADPKKSLVLLPMDPKFVEMRYVKGALIWHINRKHYNKSKLNKLIGTKIYKLMTMRNINTAKYLASL